MVIHSVKSFKAGRINTADPRYHYVDWMIIHFVAVMRFADLDG